MDPEYTNYQGFTKILPIIKPTKLHPNWTHNIHAKYGTKMHPKLTKMENSEFLTPWTTLTNLYHCELLPDF